TLSVGVARDAIAAAWIDETHAFDWSLPVVGETWDGFLNDTAGQHVTAEHTRQALAAAQSGRVQEGNVGGGTGMICHGFKGGIGTASRVVAEESGGYTVGVLVQANHGARERFRVNGLPVGEAIGDRVPLPHRQEVSRGGSIIVVAATDAPI